MIYKNSFKFFLCLSLMLHIAIIKYLDKNSIKHQDKECLVKEEIADILIDLDEIYIEKNKKNNNNISKISEIPASINNKESIKKTIKNKSHLNNAKNKVKKEIIVKTSIHKKTTNNTIHNKTNKKLKLIKENAKHNPSKNNNIVNTQENEINLYKNLINQAVSNKFYNYSDYIGQTCCLHITIAKDGSLISVKPISGDTLLCQAAISAIKMAEIPIPPNCHIYNICKNITFVFSPK